MLDLKGKAKLPSKKNFILEADGKEVMLMAKDNVVSYNVEIRWPLSLFQAFGIAISSLGFKVGC